MLAADASINKQLSHALMQGLQRQAGGGSCVQAADANRTSSRNDCGAGRQAASHQTKQRICTSVHGYTSARPEWRAANCRLEVVGERELAFFPGVARGSAFPGFQYETEAGAVAAALRFRAPRACPAPACGAPPGPADVACRPSGGGGACGGPPRPPPAAAHIPEAVPSHAARSCAIEAGTLPHTAPTRQPGSEPPASRAGAGAGPAERAGPAAARAPGAAPDALAAAPDQRGAACATEEASSDDGWVLVTREDALPGPRGAPKRAGSHARGVSEGPAAQRNAAPDAWERCVDYCNGGPVFCAERDLRGQDSGSGSRFAVLAEYAELGGAPAAVRCRVGAGRAVLVGTHPELAPHWLDAACASGGPDGEGPGAGAAPALQARAAGVREVLAAGAAARRRLWRMLLSEAGMHGLRI